MYPGGISRAALRRGAQAIRRHPVWLAWMISSTVNLSEETRGIRRDAAREPRSNPIGRPHPNMESRGLPVRSRGYDQDVHGIRRNTVPVGRLTGSRGAHLGPLWDTMVYHGWDFLWGAGIKEKPCQSLIGVMQLQVHIYL